MAKILYFVEGVITPKDAAEIEAVGANLRNAMAFREGDELEECDGVLGKAPKAYVDAFGIYMAKTETSPKKDK
jgi:hypothetical protein